MSVCTLHLHVWQSTFCLEVANHTICEKIFSRLQIRIFHTHTQAHRQPCTVYTHAYKHTLMHMRTHTHTHTGRGPCAHTHTHTHTHTGRGPCWSSCNHKHQSSHSATTSHHFTRPIQNKSEPVQQDSYHPRSNCYSTRGVWDRVFGSHLHGPGGSTELSAAAAMAGGGLSQVHPWTVSLYVRILLVRGWSECALFGGKLLREK